MIQTFVMTEERRQRKRKKTREKEGRAARARTGQEHSEPLGSD